MNQPRNPEHALRAEKADGRPKLHHGQPDNTRSPGHNNSAPVRGTAGSRPNLLPVPLQAPWAAPDVYTTHPTVPQPARSNWHRPPPAPAPPPTNTAISHTPLTHSAWPRGLLQALSAGGRTPPGVPNCWHKTLLSRRWHGPKGTGAGGQRNHTALARQQSHVCAHIPYSLPGGRHGALSTPGFWRA